MMFYNNNWINILFDDPNLNDYGLNGLDEDEKENCESLFSQDLYHIKNDMLYPYIDKNNKIGGELLPTCDYSKEILKVFPFQSEKKLADDEEEIAEEKKLFQVKNEDPKKDSINTLPEIDTQNLNLNENINISNTYMIDNIKKELIQNDFPKDITNKIKREYITKKDIENVYKFKVRPKQKKDKSNTNISQKILGIKRGRKNKKNGEKGKHTKNTSDNILKKCKRVLFDNIIAHSNSYINKYKKKRKEYFELQKLNYKQYIDKLKKEDEIKLFSLKLKDFVSLKINAKCSLKFSEDYNKIIMKKILEEEKNNEVINSFLNMTFGEWIDVFTLKRKLNYNSNFNGLQNTLNKLSKEEEDDDDDEYFTRFILYLFNYKNSFQNKKGRNPKKSKNKQDTGNKKEQK